MMLKMLLTIIRHELRTRRFLMVWWSVGIVALTVLTVLAYGSVKAQANDLNKAFGHLSSNISGFVGTSNMFSPAGYLNSQLLYITLPILFIILSVTVASSLVRKDERQRTMELLLARPVGRSQLLAAKALAGSLVVAIIGLVTLAAMVGCSWAVHIGVPYGDIALATLWMVLFSGAIGAVAFMLYSVSLLTQKAAAAVAILLSLGGYIISSLGAMVHQLAWPAKLFPYHYYDPGAILAGSVSRGLIICTFGLYVVSLALALAGFRRRDLT